MTPVKTGDQFTLLKLSAITDIQADLEGTVALSASSALASAIAAGAPIYADTTAGLAATIDGDTFLVPVEGGFIVYENDTGTAVELARTPRLTYASFAVFIADVRTFPAGTAHSIPSIQAQYVASATTGNLGQTNAGGQEFDVVPASVGYSVKAFGALGDGTTTDTVAVQNCFNASILDGQVAYVPPGTYILASTTVGIVYINFTANNQSFICKGAGRDVSVFKEKAGETLAGGRFTKMFYLQIEASYAIDELVWEGVTFDKNGASNGTPPTLYAWEQAHCFQIASTSWGSITPTIRSFRGTRIGFRDKVGAGFNIAAQMYIDSIVFDDVIEDGWSDIFGQRGDLEITAWCEHTVFINCDLLFVQTEAISGWEASATKLKNYFYTDCNIKTLQLGEVVTAAAGFATATLNNVKCETQFSFRGVNVKASNSVLRHDIECWCPDAVFMNCDMLLKYDHDTSTVTSFYFKYEGDYKQRCYIGGGSRFIADTALTANITNGAAVGRASHAKITTLDQCVITLDGVEFDARMAGTVFSYGTPNIVLRNSVLRSHTTESMTVGGFSSFAGGLELSGNNYDGVGGINKVRVISGADNWVLKIDEALDRLQLRCHLTGATAVTRAMYPTRPRYHGSAIPTVGYFFVGDYVANSVPSVDANDMFIRGWVCTVAGASGTWVADYGSTVSPAT